MIRGLFPAAALSMALSVVLGGAAFGQSLEARGVDRIVIETLHVGADIEQGVALVTVDQTFRNPGDAIAEGIYRFRLPEDAVVHSFSMWMEGREKHGQVLEAQHARRVYDSIVHARRDPGLLEQVGWRDFKVSVFPIPARDTVRIRMQYAFIPLDDLGLQSIELPLPVDAGAIGDLQVDVRVRGNRVLGVLDCPSHVSAKLTRSGTEGRAHWDADGAVPTGPFIARWAPEQSGFDVSVLAHRPGGEGEGFFVARIVPRLPKAEPIPRDVVFVLDRSGSMEGPKLRQALAALERGLATLCEQDRFGIVSFASDVEGPQEHLSPATDKFLARARRSLDDVQAGGGTNIDGALERAAGLRSDDSGRLFLVVFLTDGDATVGECQPDRIVARFRATSEGRTRLFAFGVGEGVKEFLLTRLARTTRGAAVYLRDGSQLEVKLSSLFAKVRSPVLVSPQMEVEGVPVRLLEPRPLPDVYRGGAVVLAGRYAKGGPATFRLTGRQGEKEVSVDVDVDLPVEAVERPHVAQLWARHRIERLLDDLRVHGNVTEIRKDVVRLGVKHQIVTPYTSFLVVEDGVDVGVHVPDEAESARVPEGPSGGETGSSVHRIGSRSNSAPTGGNAPGPVDNGRAPIGARGPTGEIPPESREPSDAPPPPDNSGPQTPGGEGGGSDVGGPDTGGGGPSGPSTGGGGGPAPRPAARGPTPGDWIFWWAHNRDALAAELRDARRATEDGAWRETVREEAAPVLTAVALDEKANFYTRASALRALARMGDDGIEPYLRQRALGTSATRDHKVVQEQAALALGWLPDPSDDRRDFLLRCLHPSRGESCYARPMAALALAYQALIGGRTGPDADPVVVQALLDTLQRRERKPDVKPAALVALGLIRAESAVRDLYDLLPARDESGAPSILSDVERAYVAQALGMIRVPGLADPETGVVGTEVVDALLARATTRNSKESHGVRRTCMLALGRITPAAPRATQFQVVHRLGDRTHQLKRPMLRQFAAASLGRIGADPRTPERVVSEAIGQLVRLVGMRFGSDHRRAYAALALAHVARQRGDRALTKSVALRLEAAARSSGAPVRAGIWLARGAVGGPGASDVLRKAYFRAATGQLDAPATGWALCDPDAAVIAFENRIASSADERELGALARAAQFTGSAALADDLLAALESGTESAGTSHALASALGDCGDAHTARKLLVIASDPGRRFSDLDRATACAALGLMGARPGLPGIELISTDHNWRVYVPALQEVLNWP